MRKFLLYTLLLSVSLPAIAAENEFKFGVTTNTRYNSNVNNVEENKTDAFVFEVGPRLRFDTRHSKYEGGLSYSPRFATYSDGGRVDELNQYLGANGQYRPSERLTLSLRDVLSIESDADRDITDEVTPDLDDGSRKTTLRNVLNGNVRYGFSQRGSATLNGGYNLIRREDKDLSDVDSFSGRIQTDYVATMRNTIGIGSNLRHQRVEASRERNKTVTDYYGVYLFASHRFNQMLGLQASGGPTWLRSSRENDGRSGRETEIEYFANAVLTADFERGSASLEYARASSDVAFSSTTYLIDQVSASIDWQFTPRLFGGLIGEWNERDAVLRFNGDSFANSVTQWIAAANLSLKMTPEVFMGLTVDYMRQKTDEFDAVDRVRAVIRFDYNAEAIRF